MLGCECPGILHTSLLLFVNHISDLHTVLMLRGLAYRSMLQWMTSLSPSLEEGVLFKMSFSCFWDATWPHVLVVHPVHACSLLQAFAQTAGG